MFQSKRNNVKAGNFWFKAPVLSSHKFWARKTEVRTGLHRCWAGFHVSVLCRDNFLQSWVQGEHMKTSQGIQKGVSWARGPSSSTIAFSLPQNCLLPIPPSTLQRKPMAFINPLSRGGPGKGPWNELSCHPCPWSPQVYLWQLWITVFQIAISASVRVLWNQKKNNKSINK